MNIHAAYHPFLLHFRSRRLRTFYDTFDIRPSTKVLDVGGSLFFWRLAADEGLPLPKVTIVNLCPPAGHQPAAVAWAVADARRLPFADSTFDIAFSNSVIEHISPWNSQVEFALEIRRVARHHFVQTPNRRFPVEPHLLTPFIHWLPRKIQLALVRNCTVWGLITRPTPAQGRRFLEEVRLLSPAEMARLFPDSALVREISWGFVKSLIAVE